MYKEEQLKSIFQGKRILLAGYGREGKSSERLIRSLLPEADITIVEGNDAIRQQAPLGYDLIVKSPGIPTFVFEGLCNLDTITSQTDIFLQVYGQQTIGVTGTKGKSTTTNLIAAIMRAHTPHTLMAGNMGIPLFDIADQLNDQSVVVAEFSCHQLENIHRAPHIGVLLNLFQEHLDHYHSYLDYQLAKLQIGLRQAAGDAFYYSQDNPELASLVAQYAPQIASQVIPYGLDTDLSRRLALWERKLQGDHNLSNIVVACLVALRMGVGEETVRSVVSRFTGLEHRMELVGTYEGVTYYNDSISTIPQAAIAAIEALQKVDTLILGGFDRGIDYSVLARYLAHHPIPNLVFVGEAGLRIRQAYHHELSSSAPVANELVENDYQAIVSWCKTHTAKGRICLLSPAAASYDAFRNFEHRGQLFKELVRQ